MDVLPALLLVYVVPIVVVAFVLYFIIRKGVRDGMLDAWEERPRAEAQARSIQRQREQASRPITLADPDGH